MQSAQRDVFNEVFIGPPSADNQWSNQPPRDVFNTGFCAELPTDVGQSISRRPKVVCKGGPPTAGNNEEFNQDFVGQLPIDKQFGNTANTLQMRSARDGFKEAFVRQSPTRLQTPTPRYYPWYHYRSQPSTDKQSRSRPPESSQPGAQRDVFNDAIVGQLPTDPQTPTPRYHIWYQPYSGQPSTVKQSKSRPPASSQPGAQRDVFNDAIVGQLPTDPQTPTPRYHHPWYQPYSGQPSTDKQSKSRPPASSQPGAQRDIFNKAFLGQLPTDIQTPTSRYQPYSGHLPTDKQSRIRPPESRQPGTQNDVFNEAFMGELSTDPQPTQRPRSLSRDPLNEAFIRKSSTDNQSKGRIPCIAKSRSKRRDPLVIGQLPKDQSRLQTSYGVGSQSFSTPKAAFNRGFRGQLSVDVQSTPSRGGYKKADTGPSNPRLRLCGK
ncbi:unnamed protein product [Acanthoscelides obtectus]|nr:unnamed protein product [Acanthoscelides obtectus]CAK1664143.1 hypothetical protein AOBTE_LOCUS24080 [Acanthoscelides obtectus]